MGFIIRQMQAGDVDSLAKNFARLNKERTLYEMFWEEHQAGRRITLIAVSEEECVGYTNLCWQSEYVPFQEKDIPEIATMHVLDEFQGQGIGTALIQEAERLALAHGKAEIGIGFGLTADYGVAQRLYVKLGYIPDGRGAQPSPWGDELFLTRLL